MDELKMCGCLAGAGTNKFLVVKRDDMNEALSEEGKKSLASLCTIVQCYRQGTNRDPNPQYLVINGDEPYAHEVIEILKRNGHWG